MKLSIIIPTIKGREDELERTQAAYVAHTPFPFEFVVVHDHPTWGHACNVGFRRAKGDVLHFGADDLEPLPGWADDVLPALEEADELPAARVLDYSRAGPMNNALDGADRALVEFTRVPILTRDQYERIGGPWPEYHYVPDVWLSRKARTIGIPTRIYYSYAFVHHWSQVGRLDTPEYVERDAQVLAQLTAEL